MDNSNYIPSSKQSVTNQTCPNTESKKLVTVCKSLNFKNILVALIFALGLFFAACEPCDSVLCTECMENYTNNCDEICSTCKCDYYGECDDDDDDDWWDDDDDDWWDDDDEDDDDDWWDDEDEDSDDDDGYSFWECLWFGDC